MQTIGMTHKPYEAGGQDYDYESKEYAQADGTIVEAPFKDPPQSRLSTGHQEERQGKVVEH
jgi:hypothetical protein